MLRKHNQNELVLKRCIVSDADSALNTYFWCKNLGLAVTLLITL